MNGSTKFLTSILDGNDKKLVVPVYQRRYSWSQENCKQLFDDLEKIAEENSIKRHFFGSLVLGNPDAAPHVFVIIDGQQRLTTVSLLLLAIANLLKEHTIHSEKRSLNHQIYDSYIVHQYADSQKDKMRLIPIQEDCNTWQDLIFTSKDAYKPETINSKLTENYQYFRKRITGFCEKARVDCLYDAIKRLEVMEINLGHDDNPQRIFESLNSTGLGLNESEKICNYLLMDKPYTKQEQLYDTYWKQIYKLNENYLDTLIKHYLSIKTKAIPNEKQLYDKFKDHIKDKTGDNIADLNTDELLSEMLQYSKRYETLREGKKGFPSELNACIQRLQIIKTDVTSPFLLEVLRLYDEKVLSVDEVTRVFAITESYIFRRAICGIGSNGMNKTFLSLHQEIMNQDKTAKNFVEKMKFVLYNKKRSGRFPNDEEFRNSFAVRDIYNMTRYRGYILERFENGLTKETKVINIENNTYQKLDDTSYTIEHVMPQKLSDNWIAELGSDYKQIHEKWIHNIANLTLTAYNSKYGNETFQRKKDMENGFSKSGLRMNQYFAKLEHWNQDELEKRNNMLMDKALKIWEKPECHYAPPEKTVMYESFSLDDEDEDPTNKLLTKFSLRGTEYTCESWIEMYKTVCESLYEEDQTVFKQIASKSGRYPELENLFSTHQSDLRSPGKLTDGIFYEKNISNEAKLSALRKIFDCTQKDGSELTFFFLSD